MRFKAIQFRTILISCCLANAQRYLERLLLDVAASKITIAATASAVSKFKKLAERKTSGKHVE